MISTDASAADTTAVRSSPITWGWFLKRSMLWVVILFVAVLAACLLYGFAGGPLASQSQTTTSTDAQAAARDN